MRNKIIAGNWKMNGRLSDTEQLLHDLTCYQAQLLQHVIFVVFPPSIYLDIAQRILQSSKIQWGAQNCFFAENGAFTGEITAGMCKDFGCTYILVGHSERRQLFAETEKIVINKFYNVQAHGMIPILCIGESELERENGQTDRVLEKQLTFLKDCDVDNIVIVYEPIWAIGSGQAASTAEINAAHAYIRDYLTLIHSHKAEKISLLYGGSVNQHNAKDIFACPNVDGALIGGASLYAQQFLEIIKCIN